MATEKTLQRVLSGSADANIRFDDLVNVLHGLGFEMRIRGSHHMFRRADITEKLNLQRDGNHAKPYQVRQVRVVILKYNLGGMRHE